MQRKEVQLESSLPVLCISIGLFNLIIVQGAVDGKSVINSGYIQRNLLSVQGDLLIVQGDF